MFSLKKKKMKGIQGGAFPKVDPVLSEEIGEPPFEWLEQHHKKTLNTQTHLQSPTNNNASVQPSINIYNVHSDDASPPMHLSNYDYPQSGDESDNHHSQREHLRSQFYTPDPQKRTKEYHIEQSMQAVELLKAASKPNGWKKVEKHKSGCIVYQSTSAETIPGHGENKYPAFKGEHVIRGYKAQEVFSIVNVRKLWDDWYDELSCVETYDQATALLYMVMKGTLSAKTRDIAMVERIVHESDGTIYSAACSVESTKIPAASGKITYVIQTDLLSRLPKFIAKRSLIKRALAITTVETYLKKNGAPFLTPNASGKPTNRHRSLSEPLKLDRFLIPPESEEDDEPSGSSFLSPLEPLKSRQDVLYMDESADSEEEESSIRRTPQLQNSANLRSPANRHSLASSKSLFSQDFMKGNSFMSDSNMFGDASSLFGKGDIFENSQKKQEEPPALPRSPRPQPSHSKKQPQERLPEKSQERLQERTSERLQEKTRFIPGQPKPISSETEPRKPPATKRISIPVVAPKSEARIKNHLGSSYSDSNNQLAVPESALSAGLLALNTPPLTPPASVDGKDGTSDSDATHSSSEAAVVVVPRSPKNSTEPVNTSRPNSLAMSSLGMKSPSAMMEATTRRHSTLMSRTAAFVPRHSHVIPIRGNPNVSLQSLTRPSGPNGTMTTAMKRHSTAPSLDSNRSSTTYTPVMVLPHRHSETARKALAMFKVLASSPEDRWRAISSDNGFKSYSRVISGAGLPMLRGEGTITGGWTVEQINAVIESSGCRQVWDERFENMSIAETFNHNEYLFHISLRGVGSLTDPQTSALYNVSTSVLDPTIPEDPGRIRAMLELSGWSLRPTFDGQGNTVAVNVTFVIQIDIRGNLPSSVVKSMTSSMTMAVSRLNQFINKSGYPPFASHISGTRLLDTFEPKTGFYELCYKAAPGWTEVRIGRKVYKDGYDFFIKPDDPSVKVEMAPDFGGVRVWTTLDHEGQSVIAQVSRKGQNAIVEPMEQQQQQETQATEEDMALKDGFKDGVPRHSEIEVGERHSTPSSRKRRSASYATPSTGAIRPDSQASASSERSRSRGRTPRSIVTLPAGTPPPPLPRRSSSLSRYSIPLSAYLPGADAPPVPINTSLTNNAVTASTIDTSEISLTPRPVSESLGSPTLGFFHIPVVPVTPVTATATEVKRTSAVVSSVASSSHMENITAVLAEKPMTQTTGAIGPENCSLATVATAQVAPGVESVSVALKQDRPSMTPVNTQVSSKDKMAEQVVSALLSSQASPTSTPVPSPMASAFSPRGSPLPSTLVTATLSPSSLAASPLLTMMTAAVPSTTVSPATTLQPVSSLKNRASSASLGGTARRREARVTFSLDTVDKSSSSEENTATHEPSSTLDNIMKINSGISAVSLAKEHTVKVVAAPSFHHREHQAAVILQESYGSDSESDEGEFMEARDEWSDDEMELALILTSIGSWPSMSSKVVKGQQEKKKRAKEMVDSSIKALESGVRMVATGAPREVKVAIVFLLLVYYAGRLASLMA
ncbi:hypothetical protein EDD11_004613 [Mortierella claussenii]|nr:hypothetical protein EDD11_004613 [Mortierella claussenii]